MDLISRTDAIDTVAYAKDGKDAQRLIWNLPSAQLEHDLDGYSSRLWKAAYERGKADAQSEQSIDYVRGYNDAKREIALSGEYERAYQRGKDDALSERKTGKWIPISKATNPKKSGWYIVTISEEMTADNKRFSGIAEYNATTEEWYDMDEPTDLYLAWQPLPEPYSI